MMAALSTSETTVNFYDSTWQNIPEGSHRHTRRHKNLKSQVLLYIYHRTEYFYGIPQDASSAAKLY
jgi:hypothetical protein